MRSDTRAVVLAALLAPGAAPALGCIDVGALKKPSTSDGGDTTGTIRLGDFEDHTAKPRDTRFANYQYYAYNPDDLHFPAGAFVSSPIVAPGNASNYALGLNWKVIDVEDGAPNYPGVGVRTLVSTGFVDLSTYDRIVFAHRYQHTDGCRAVRNLAVSVGCNELNTSFVGYVPLASDWTTTSMSFSTFAEPTYLPPSGHTLAECLRVVNGIDFQAQVNLADGDCASGSLALDDLEIRPSPSNADGGDANTPSAGILIVPDDRGAFDGGNAAGVVGAWWSLGDWYSAAGAPGAGTCAEAGFTAAQCSTIAAPMPGVPFTPDRSGRGMCTTGVAGQVINGDGGAPAYSAIWGNEIGFNLNAAGDGGVMGTYDAPARGITGFAFDLEGSITRLRVGFATEGTWNDPAYWQGATIDLSPVRATGHYEIRWAEVGGPLYLMSPPPFDPSKLQAIRFHIVSDPLQSTPYSFCIKNTVMLTGP